MPKTRRSYRSWQLEQLSNPIAAANYLNAALKDSPGIFLRALGKVAQAHQMARVAKKSGVARENLYRALSETGNPTLETLQSVLTTVGLKLAIATDVPSAKTAKSSRYSHSLAAAVVARTLASKMQDQLTLGHNVSLASQTVCQLGTGGQKSISNAGAVGDLQLLPGFMQQQRLAKIEEIYG